jgi:branched-chain amino acid transport system permease protein
MDQFLQVLFTGLSQGAIYALIGIGFGLVNMSSRVLNLAHGAYVMYGGFLFITLANALGLPPLAVVPFVLVAIAAIGLVTERVLNARSSPWQPVSLDAIVLLTLALLVVFEGLAFVIWGPQPRRGPFLHSGTITIGGAVIVWQAVWMLVAAAVLAFALHYFLHHTWLGLAMRATAQSTVTAYLLGIDRRAIGVLSFGLGATTGALAGILISPVTWLDYQAAGVFTVKGMLAYLIGGEEDVAGPLAGGLLLGLAENVLLIAPGVMGGLLKQVVPMVVLLLILQLRPQGLLGRRQVTA